MKTRKRSKKEPCGIYGCLIIIILILALSALSSLQLLQSKIHTLTTVGYFPGVMISTVLLSISTAFLVISLLLILFRKRCAVKITFLALGLDILFMLWYFFLGPILLYTGFDKISVLENNLFLFILNLIIIIPVVCYLKKSRRVKNTCIR